MNAIRQNTTVNHDRRGAVAVEFAIVAPVLLAIVFGMMEYGRAFEMKNLLQVAAREGARFASMDHDGLVSAGQTSNQKLINDVKNFLVTNGIAASDVTVQVKDHANPAADFNIDDPANDLKLFDVVVTVYFSRVALRPVSAGHDYPLTAKVVFRNGRAAISS